MAGKWEAVKEFVCSGLGPGQTSGLQLSRAQNQPHAAPTTAPSGPRMAPAHPSTLRPGRQHPGGSCLAQGRSGPAIRVLCHSCTECAVLSPALGAVGVIVGVTVDHVSGSVARGTHVYSCLSVKAFSCVRMLG